MFDPLSLEYFVLEDVAVVLEEVDIPDISVAHTKVHWLVTLRVLHVLHHCHWLRLTPVPQSYRTVHVITHHELGVKRRLGDAIQQGTDPLRPPNAAWFSRKYKLFSIGEELDIVCGRCDKIDIDWLLDAYVMLNDGI